MWRFNSLTRVPQRVLSDEEEAADDSEASPTHFDTTDFSKFLEVSKDKLTIRYTGPGDHETDVGSIQGNRMVPKQQRVFYYEATIVDAGLKGLIALGFAEKGFNLGKHPGAEMNSYGYDAETGKKMAGSTGPSRSSSQAYGPIYTTGDVVGAGILLETQEMFFTKNGQNLGVAFKNVLRVPLYPTVGLHSRNEHVEANFGAKPFVFDLDALVHRHRLQQESAVQSVDSQEGLSHAVVQDYLLHHGYAETLRAFEQSTGKAPATTAQPMQEDMNGAATPPRAESAYGKLCQALQDVTKKSPVTPAKADVPDSPRGRKRQAAEETLEVRHRMRQRIMAGDVQGAVEEARTSGLRLFQGQLAERMVEVEVDFFWKCMAFVELVRGGKVEAAVSLAQTDLAPLRGRFLERSEEFDCMLHDVVALLAYSAPEKSTLGPLFLDGQREAVADMLNQAVLYAELQIEDATQPAPQAALEKLLMQLVSVQDELHTACGYGPRFRLSEHLRWTASHACEVGNGAGGSANEDANGVTGMEIQDNLNGLNGQP